MDLFLELKLRSFRFVRRRIRKKQKERRRIDMITNILLGLILVLIFYVCLVIQVQASETRDILREELEKTNRLLGLIENIISEAHKQKRENILRDGLDEIG